MTNCLSLFVLSLCPYVHACVYVRVLIYNRYFILIYAKITGFEERVAIVLRFYFISR